MAGSECMIIGSNNVKYMWFYVIITWYSEETTQQICVGIIHELAVVDNESLQVDVRVNMVK